MVMNTEHQELAYIAPRSAATPTAMKNVSQLNNKNLKTKTNEEERKRVVRVVVVVGREEENRVGVKNEVQLTAGS
jgi:hypothetical protein